MVSPCSTPARTVSPSGERTFIYIMALTTSTEIPYPGRSLSLFLLFNQTPWKNPQRAVQQLSFCYEHHNPSYKPIFLAENHFDLWLWKCPFCRLIGSLQFCLACSGKLSTSYFVDGLLWERFMMYSCFVVNRQDTTLKWRVVVFYWRLCDDPTRHR